MSAEVKQAEEVVSTEERVSILPGGEFGSFFAAEREDGQPVMVRRRIGTEGRVAGREKYFLQNFPHAHVIQYYDHGFYRSNCYSILERMTQSLRSFLRAQDKLLHPKTSWRFVCQLIAVMKHLHKNHLIHRAISSSVFWVNDDEQLKLVDVSSVKSVGEEIDLPDVQEPAYKAPELHDGKPHSKASDMYAFAMVVWEVLTCKKPWGGVRVGLIKLLVGMDQRPKIPDRTFKVYRSILERGWQGNPQCRSTARAVYDCIEDTQNRMSDEFRFLPV